jgi:hypothetical protein
MSESQNGRPPAVLSPKQIDQVEALAAVCTKAQMAAYFGITEKTFRAIEQRQSEVLPLTVEAELERSWILVLRYIRRL